MTDDPISHLINLMQRDAEQCNARLRRVINEAAPPIDLRCVICGRPVSKTKHKVQRLTCSDECKLEQKHRSAVQGSTRVAENRKRRKS